MAIRSTASGIAARFATLLLIGLLGHTAPALGATAGMATNAAPVISGTPSNRVVAGDFYDFRPTASDPNRDRLTFSINKIPRWAHFDTSTGRLYGTPARSDHGKMRRIRISVSDGTASAALGRFNLRVARGDVPRIAGTPPARVKAGRVYSFQPTATDTDGQKLSFAIIGKPTWATFNKSTGRLSGTPGPASAGTYEGVSISVTDGASTVSLAPFAITVQSERNAAPTISGAPAASAEVGKTYAFQPSASDADGDALSFSIVNLPAWASFNSKTGRITGTPQAGSVGTYPEIVLSVSDGSDVTFLPMFSISVSAATAPPPPPPTSGNNPPRISGTPAKSVTIGQSYVFQPSASDPDGQALTFGILNLPPWATFSASTGRLSGTPVAADAGTWSNVVISVTDGKATASLSAFSIAVNQTGNGAATVSWDPPTENTDGTALTDLAGYRIRYGLAPNALANVVTIPNAGVTSAVIENLGPGTWYFGVVAYNTSAVESPLSDLAQKTIK